MGGGKWKSWEGAVFSSRLFVITSRIVPWRGGGDGFKGYLALRAENYLKKIFPLNYHLSLLFSEYLSIFLHLLISYFRHENSEEWILIQVHILILCNACFKKINKDENKNSNLKKQISWIPKTLPIFFQNFTKFFSIFHQTFFKLLIKFSQNFNELFSKFHLVFSTFFTKLFSEFYEIFPQNFVNFFPKFPIIFFTISPILSQNFTDFFLTISLIFL